MADVEVSYKGSTIGSLSASGTLTLETEGTWCEDDITVDYTSPGGGGGSEESGTFIATTSDNLTIPVTSLHSYLEVWLDEWDLSASLSGNPYGAYMVLSRLFISQDATDPLARAMLGYMTNYAGTAYTGFAEISQPSGATSGGNRMSFTSSSITISVMRVGGTNRQFVDGATYHWRAW